MTASSKRAYNPVQVTATFAHVYSKDDLMPASLRSPAATRDYQRQLAESILKVALDAVDPFHAVERALQRQGAQLQAGGRRYDLSAFHRVLVVGAGKAGAPMARAAESILGDKLTEGLVNVKYGCVAPTSLISVNEAGHPLPDARGLDGARRIAQLLQSATEDDLVICLISGGGSALLTLPVPGVSLEDLTVLTSSLLGCGATINEINAVRKHLSQVKGGLLARLSYPATVITLILSDVVGNPLDVIASGPTVPDPTTFQDAWNIIAKYGLESDIPTPIVNVLDEGRRGLRPETPKPGDPVFERVNNVIVASNYVAAKAAERAAKNLGFSTLLFSTYVEGEAREVAKVLAGIAKEIKDSGNPVRSPGCVIAGGETTVTLKGKGKGGRNTELALSAAIAMQGLEGAMIFSAATDGSDGPTDAGGAFAFGDTVRRASEMGLNPLAYLQDNDSYNFFAKLGDLAITGPTNTNVNDLIFVLTFD